MAMRMVSDPGVFQKMTRLVAICSKGRQDVELCNTGGETELDRNVR